MVHVAPSIQFRERLALKSPHSPYIRVRAKRNQKLLRNLYKRSNFFNMVLICYSIAIYEHYIEQVKEMRRTQETFR